MASYTETVSIPSTRKHEEHSETDSPDLKRHRFEADAPSSENCPAPGVYETYIKHHETLKDIVPSALLQRLDDCLIKTGQTIDPALTAASAARHVFLVLRSREHGQGIFSEEHEFLVLGVFGTVTSANLEVMEAFQKTYECMLDEADEEGRPASRRAAGYPSTWKVDEGSGCLKLWAEDPEYGDGTVWAEKWVVGE
ncbi:hypothetical protein JX266_009456 [Neoarthrinium moseri]|nr:hypothetical protein JX266_009456 [Neoarthrinium moseri]